MSGWGTEVASAGCIVDLNIGWQVVDIEAEGGNGFAIVVGYLDLAFKEAAL